MMTMIRVSKRNSSRTPRLFQRCCYCLRGLTACILLEAVGIEKGVQLCPLRNHTYTESGHCRGQTEQVYFCFSQLRCGVGWDISNMLRKPGDRRQLLQLTRYLGPVSGDWLLADLSTAPAEFLQMAWKVGVCCEESFFLILIFDSLAGIRTAYGLARVLLCTFPVCLSPLFGYRVWGISSEKVQTVCVGGF